VRHTEGGERGGRRDCEKGTSLEVQSLGNDARELSLPASAVLPPSDHDLPAQAAPLLPLNIALASPVLQHS
jgi:hypothetical protein